MAEDWVKMTVGLSTNRAVIGMARALGKDPDLIVGKLHKLWSWADSQTSDGWIENVDSKWINSHLKTRNFAENLAKVGWIVLKPDGVLFTDFETHNGISAKKRAGDAKRKRAERRENVRESPDNNRTRVEREERENGIEEDIHTRQTSGSPDACSSDQERADSEDRTCARCYYFYGHNCHLPKYLPGCNPTTAVKTCDDFSAEEWPPRPSPADQDQSTDLSDPRTSKPSDPNQPTPGNSAEARGIADQPARPAPTEPSGSSAKPRRKSKTVLSDHQMESFLAWYSLYPRKVAKGAAVRAWAKLNPDADLWHKLIDAIRAQVASGHLQGSEPQHTPHPATWLNGKRWTDEIQEQGSCSGSKSKTGNQCESIRTGEPMKDDDW